MGHRAGLRVMAPASTLSFCVGLTPPPAPPSGLVADHASSPGARAVGLSPHRAEARGTELPCDEAGLSIVVPSRVPGVVALLAAPPTPDPLPRVEHGPSIPHPRPPVGTQEHQEPSWGCHQKRGPPLEEAQGPPCDKRHGDEHDHARRHFLMRAHASTAASATRAVPCRMVGSDAAPGRGESDPGSSCNRVHSREQSQLDGNLDVLREVPLIKRRV